MNLFCSEEHTSIDSPFHTQILFATLGAVNCGIDNHNMIYGIFRIEIPPLCGDMVQEEGRAGRRICTNPITYMYTVSISLD